MVGHVRCVRILSSSPAQFSQITKRHILSGMQPAESFSILCQGFVISAFEVSAATPTQRKRNFAPGTQQLHMNNSTATCLSRNNVLVTVDNLAVRTIRPFH